MKIRLPHHFPPNKSPMKINVLQTILYQSKKKKKKRQTANPEQGHTQGE